MHKFWGIEVGVARKHETQNFSKNVAIITWLNLLLAHGADEFSADNRVKRTSSTK
jgi:putative oxidoreductase